MKRSMVLSGAVLLAAAMGCESTGLSPRQADPRLADRQAMSLQPYALPQAENGEPVAPIRRPMKLVVAQSGQSTPPLTMLQSLRKETALFERVDPLPGPDSVALGRTLSTARQTGADYLFLFGGNIDSDTNATGWAALDLTILGAFIVPSRQIRAEGQASGALIDLRSGRVAVFASADARENGAASAVAVDDRQTALRQSIRDELIGELAGDLIERVKR